MTVNSSQIQIIKDSWGILIAYSDKAADIFYTTFFELLPESKALFKDDMQSQSRKLLNAITLMVAKLDKLDMLHEDLKYLSKRHITYGVKVEYFAPFQIAFMQMLKTVFEDKWTFVMEDAWQNLLAMMSNAMKDDMEVSQRMTMDSRQ
jgi:hemoglobin-like flavoprotein